MKISVAMCTYNGEQYLRQQLDSIFAQTLLPDEIVVCDDISKDNTLEILESYQDRGIRLRVYQNPENLGFAQNFRKCLSLCEGDVIFLCDQDDAWEETKVTELVQLMEQNPKMLSVVTNFYLMDENGSRLGKGERGENPFFCGSPWKIDWKKENLYKINLTSIFSCNIGPGCTQAIRREIVEDLLCCDLWDPHDFLLNRAAALHDGLYYYDKPLTYYRVHGKQTIGVPPYAAARLRKDYGAIAEEYFNIFRELIYHLFIPNSGKVSMPPEFDDTYLIKYYDTIPMDEAMREQYEKWKKMTANRAVLYTTGTKKLMPFLRQGRYNKYFVFDYAPVERMRLRAWDLAVLLKRR